MKRLHAPPDFHESHIHRLTGGTGRPVIGPPRNLTVSYLDTHDWRLHRSGLVLTEERNAGRRLILIQNDRDSVAIPVGSCPRFAADLPPGYLAELVGPVLGIRALLQVGAVRVERREGRIENSNGDIVTLLRIERVEPLNAAGRSTAPATVVLGLSDPSVLEMQLETAPNHDLVAAAAARGRRPDDYSSKLDIPLDGGLPAVVAVRTILLGLLDTLEANVDGTIAGDDPEFLHDLRVASRRTRSALTQLKGVLPADLVAHANAEFKWLGNVTGPMRDLDVFQLELPVYRGMLPEAASADLAPLEKLIGDERRTAHRSVTHALKSARFSNLVTTWRKTLGTIDPSAAGTGTSTRGLAAKRITKAYGRILKKGRNLGTDPPAEKLHRVRIDAKKLRYLLEFFKNLYPKTEIADRIKELKQLQNILGGFNDMEVQRTRLSEFARTLHADPEIPTSSLLTLGRLAGMLDDRQEEYRLAFHDAFVLFSSNDVRAAYGRLFGAKESM